MPPLSLHHLRALNPSAAPERTHRPTIDYIERRVSEGKTRPRSKPLPHAQRPDRLERAAIRWHGRFEIEASTLSLAESRFALAALERLPADRRAADMLRSLLREASPTSVPQVR